MGWTQAAAIRRFEVAVTALGEQPPSTTSLKRMFAYWESGDRTVTVPIYQQAFATIYHASARDLGFGPSSQDDEAKLTSPETVGGSPESDDRGQRGHVGQFDSRLGTSAGRQRHRVKPERAGVEFVHLGDLDELQPPALRQPGDGPARGSQWRIDWFGRWPVWSLPRGLRLYVVLVVGLWLGLAGWAATGLRPRSADLLIFCALIGCALVSIESSRRFGEATDRVWRDMLGVWTLPLMLLLPPGYALLTPVALQLFSQLRVRRSLAHRVAFSIAAIGLAYGLGSWVFHTWAGNPPSAVGDWILIGAFSAALAVAVNAVLVAVAVRMSDPAANWRGLLLSREGLILDGVQVSAGLTVTALSLSNVWLAPLVLPAVLFGTNRTAMAVQLRALAPADGKTGLLGVGTWNREARVAAARAHRQQTPLAVLLIDLDDANDQHDHQIGDLALRSFANELCANLRPGDLIGRLGEDKFAVLLPGAGPPEAQAIAERLRQAIESVRVPLLPGTIDHEKFGERGTNDGIRIKVSIVIAPPQSAQTP